MCVVCSRTVALQRCNAPCPQTTDSSEFSELSDYSEYSEFSEFSDYSDFPQSPLFLTFYLFSQILCLSLRHRNIYELWKE